MLLFKIFPTLLLLLSTCMAFGQTTAQEKMAQLAFMTGHWVGTSTAFKDGAIAEQGPVFEDIEYKMDQTLITIDLHSFNLQLHTVIYYDEAAGHYFYCPYSKTRVGKYPGQYKEGKFLVQMSETYRLVFQQTAAGKFIEYGELLKDGVWSKKFEDVLQKAP